MGRRNDSTRRSASSSCSREQQRWMRTGIPAPLFPCSGEPSNIPAVEEWYRISQEVWERAHVRLQRAVRRQRIQANRRRRPHPSYQVGQKVWLSTRNLRLKLPCRKLSPKFIGPFEIIRQVNLVAYRLRLPAAYLMCPFSSLRILRVGKLWAAESHRRLWTLRGPRHTGYVLSWTPGGSDRGSSTSWTGRGMVSRSVRGWTPLTSWILPSRRTSTATTRTSLLRARGGVRSVEPQEVFLEEGLCHDPPESCPREGALACLLRVLPGCAPGLNTQAHLEGDQAGLMGDEALPSFINGCHAQRSLKWLGGEVELLYKVFNLTATPESTRAEITMDL
ncbi:hypothetical protein QTP70_027749 [Hemibagrus guttatus]|uniref:Tf2-1-like SH3-like domain-containing protein n=1 Tax=Hemibagrus guttatus TaxID=175788 RepID=A0AAE0RAT3_9TELE|nr:hypothetical protein QTP70_027749 [Hemibagrus guttatus]